MLKLSLSKQKCGPGRRSNTNEPETLMVGISSTDIRKRNCSRRIISACGIGTRGTLTGPCQHSVLVTRPRLTSEMKRVETNGVVRKTRRVCPRLKVMKAWLALGLPHLLLLCQPLPLLGCWPWVSPTPS